MEEGNILGNFNHLKKEQLKTMHGLPVWVYRNAEIACCIVDVAKQSLVFGDCTMVSWDSYDDIFINPELLNYIPPHMGTPLSFEEIMKSEFVYVEPIGEKAVRSCFRGVYKVIPAELCVSDPHDYIFHFSSLGTSWIAFKDIPSVNI